MVQPMMIVYNDHMAVYYYLRKTRLSHVGLLDQLATSRVKIVNHAIRHAEAAPVSSILLDMIALTATICSLTLVTLDSIRVL